MICVDPLRDPPANSGWKYGECCHMFSDNGNLDELHAFAERTLQLNRQWFQDGKYPHYDLSASRRKLAVKHGAMEVDRKYIIEKGGVK